MRQTTLHSSRRMRECCLALRAINIAKWIPTVEQYKQAMLLLEPDERAMITRFVYQRDEQRRIAGRLLTRYYCSQITSTPNERLKFGKTERGKPFLIQQHNSSRSRLEFNVSHDGDFVIAAFLNSPHAVGIDIMQVNRQPLHSGKDAASFVRMFKNQFDEHEMDCMLNSDSAEERKLEMFYRHWCLKEAYVKAIGYGIGFGVDRIHVRLCSSSDRQQQQQQVPSSLFTQGWNFPEVWVDDNCITIPDWLFAEYAFGENYCVAVAVENGKQCEELCSIFKSSSGQSFNDALPANQLVKIVEVGIDDLLNIHGHTDSSSSSNSELDRLWNAFEAKDLQPNSPKSRLS